MPSEDTRFDCTRVNLHVKKQLTLAPLGDIHFNAPLHARNKFLAWCKKFRTRVKRGEDIYFLGMGDYTEILSGSERKALAGIHDSSREWMDGKVNDDIDELADRLDFTHGRWIGMLAGNHNYVTMDGCSTTEKLAKLLGAQPLGIAAGIRVKLKIGKCTGVHNYDIWAHHGKGGGVLAGSTLNSVERWANAVMGDLIVMGHDHKKASIPVEHLRLTDSGDGTDVVECETRLCRSGSFLKGYVKGKCSYVAANAMRPVPLGGCEVHITRDQTMDEISGKRADRLQTEVLG